MSTTPPTDPPKPAWLDRIDAWHDANDQKRTFRKTVGLVFSVQWHALTLRAARSRNMSIASYCRRAIMAFVFHDLGLDWEREMKAEPGIRKNVNENESLAGYGYGAWKIEGLGEYGQD